MPEDGMQVNRSPQVYYMAHPVNGDSLYSKKENMDDILETLRVLRECGIYAVVPYFADLMILPESKAQREACLEGDCAMIRAFGRIVLTGHKLSAGMKQELDALPEGGSVINLIGMSHDQIRSLILQ